VSPARLFRTMCHASVMMASRTVLQDLLKDMPSAMARAHVLASVTWTGLLGLFVSSTCKWLHSPVWRPFPQTPQAADHISGAALCQLLNGDIEAWFDCATVVAAYNQPVSNRLMRSLRGSIGTT
jgi:hypothetical protein